VEVTQDFIKAMSATQADALAKALGPYLNGEKQTEYNGYVPEGLKHYQNYKATGNPSSDAYLYVNGGLFGRLILGQNSQRLAGIVLQ
jgi:hypothetical protein